MRLDLPLFLISSSMLLLLLYIDVFLYGLLHDFFRHGLQLLQQLMKGPESLSSRRISTHCC